MASIAVARRNALLDAYGVRFNSGTLKVYAGAPPASADAALGSPTLLGTLSFAADAFQDAAAGSMAANPITQDSAADANGTASFYRALESDGTTVIEQGTVTATGGGGDLELNTVSIVAGGPIQVSSFLRTM